MAITAVEALEAMLSHHRILDEGVGSRVSALVRNVANGSSFGAVTAELVAYLAEEVLPHALAEEHTIYQVAGSRPELAATVTEMIGEHRRLASMVEGLSSTLGDSDIAKQAEQIGLLFATHVEKENDILLPALLVAGDVDLGQLLVRMHRLTEEAQKESSLIEDVAALDAEATVLSLLLEAASGLAEVGRGDRACRLVGSAWTVLRVPRPDLAVRVTAALHGLARSVLSEPVAFGSTNEKPAHNGKRGLDEVELDVRALAPAQRHESIFAAYDELTSGTAFMLVNDHDPKPLRYQFEAEHQGEFTWGTLQAGPKVWRVRIGRPLAATPTSTDDHGGGVRELDVRTLAHGQRHESIFAAYDELTSGTAFMLVNDHDPKPLRYQFEAEHQGKFTWDYVETGPKVWKVRVGKVRP